ncbi:hypothetical protein V8G54_026210 [Vigna mungo]|uniref:Uncharacterized protein n=1 Tax=Vigna mungo TaxID=3915 RepID=A0AAQ3N0M1_VIGMU
MATSAVAVTITVACETTAVALDREVTTPNREVTAQDREVTDDARSRVDGIKSKGNAMADRETIRRRPTRGEAAVCWRQGGSLREATTYARQWSAGDDATTTTKEEISRDRKK